MKILSQQSENIRRVIYKVQYDKRILNLIWYLHPEEDKIIDFEMRDKDGNSVDDPAILEDIVEYLRSDEANLS